VATLSASIAATPPPTSPWVAPQTLVARAGVKASLGLAAAGFVFAAILINRFASQGGSDLLLALGLLAAAGGLAAVRRAIRRPVEFVASGEGFTLGNDKRFIAWSEVAHIRVSYSQTAYTEEHRLVLKLRDDDPGTRPLVTTNRTNPDEVEVSLDGLSSSWQDLATSIAAISGRPTAQTRQEAFGVSKRPIGPQ
jgi:hypothetical protein